MEYSIVQLIAAGQRRALRREERKRERGRKEKKGFCVLCLMQHLHRIACWARCLAFAWDIHCTGMGGCLTYLCFCLFCVSVYLIHVNGALFCTLGTQYKGKAGQGKARQKAKALACSELAVGVLPWLDLDGWIVSNWYIPTYIQVGQRYKS
jgi:hypothetical protein